ncbi:MAG: polysaccharide deacetylase family protein [Pirellulales bacterium]|nr:polysaccharide deacetylase family protein [Pirellulales bacterium]
MGVSAAIKNTVKRWAGQRYLAADTIVLTFDDGPHPSVTPAVLERLQTYGARAVFFVVGRVFADAPGVLQQIAAAGHVLGNHSWQHDLIRNGRLVPYLRDLRRCQREIERVTRQRPRLFRPPLGRISLASFVAPRLAGLRPIYWSTELQDWQLTTDDEARRQATSWAEAIAPRDIVLLHDDNPCVLTILDVLLPRLVERGFDLERGPELLAGVADSEQHRPSATGQVVRAPSAAMPGQD